MELPSRRFQHAGMSNGYTALREGRQSPAGHAYLVSFATTGRQPHFADPAVAFDTCRWLAAPSSWADARLLAWVLMPDHWHGIVQLGTNAGLSGVITKAKGRAARAIRVKHPHIGPLWQSGFHGQAIRGDAQLLQAARYIVANPIRAGIACRVGAYPYWDAVWLSPQARG